MSSNHSMNMIGNKQINYNSTSGIPSRQNQGVDSSQKVSRPQFIQSDNSHGQMYSYHQPKNNQLADEEINLNYSYSPDSKPIKSRFSINGRKGHQVMQSAGFNKMKTANINKTFDADKNYHSYLSNQPTPIAINNSRQINQNILQQFTNVNGATVGPVRKRNQSFNDTSSLKQVINENNNVSKPGSRLGGQVPNSRGSKLNFSLHKRNLTTTIDASQTDQTQITRNNNHSALSTIEAQNKEQERKYPQISRPKTSTGLNKDRYGTVNQDHQGAKPLELKEELEQMVADRTQQKNFQIKNGERNQGLRNYLKKSLDQTANSTLLALAENGTISITKTTNLQRIKRKRDYSKVVSNTQQPSLNVSCNNVAQVLTTFSPNVTQTNKGEVLKKNLYQEKFAKLREINNHSNLTTIEPENHPEQHQNLKSREKGHQRSNTSYNFNRLKQSDQQIKSTAGSSEQSSEQPQRAQSEERTQQKQRQQHFRDMRSASITQEVSTQPQSDGKKIDNCVSKFAFATKTGYSPSNPYKVNQDSFLALPHLGEYRRTHFFAVCDGHGVYGKEVSEFVKYHLGQRVEHEIKHIFDQAKQLQRVVDSNEVKEALDVSFKFTNQHLFDGSGLDLYFSGSTCVSILIVGNKVFCANVGDSRAVLARGIDGQVCGFPLNRDHKASEPDEEERILRAGGRIDAFKDSNGRPMGPLRVWHLNENIPGLAMSRSFGDGAAVEVGVIADPEILEMNLTESDKFIVIASDGVWEFLTNDEVVNIIMPHYLNNSAEKAAEALIREALQRWKEEENVIDDITCIIIFLSIQ